jgi:SAM-dependent methyltransferase
MARAGDEADDALDYLAGNVAAWDARREDQLALARTQWAANEPTWGNFAVPDASARLLPDDLDGARTVEIGCGTAYVSAWLARRGARPVGIDPTPGQLRIAREMQREFDLHFPLVRAAGEHVPLAGGRFDVAVSEYGAAIWSDPYRWIPEAARLLRPGGRLVFLGNSTLSMLCTPYDEEAPVGESLVRDLFGMHRFEWNDDHTVEFHLSHGDWIRLLRANGFDIEDLVELQPPPGTTASDRYVPLEWARRWPSEEAWRARRR